MIRFLSPLRLVLLAALTLLVVAGFVLVPTGTSLPIHWNFAGEVDATAPREVALLLPAAIVAVLWLAFALVGRIARPAELEAGRHIASAAATLVIALAIVVETAVVAIGLGYEVAIVQVIAVTLSVLLLAVGNALPKSQPNAYAGIRIPSTLRDPANWQATHRLGGLLSMIGGAVLFIAAFLAPSAQLVFWLLACVAIPMLVAMGYSILRHP